MLTFYNVLRISRSAWLKFQQLQLCPAWILKTKNLVKLALRRSIYSCAGSPPSLVLDALMQEIHCNLNVLWRSSYQQ